VTNEEEETKDDVGVVIRGGRERGSQWVQSTVTIVMSTIIVVDHDRRKRS